MDRARRVNAGDRIRIHHETWNEIVDATVAARRGGVRGGPADLYANRQTILVRNMSGSALDLGAIVALSEPTIDPADDVNRFVQRVVMDVIAPTSTTASKFAVTVEPIASGAMGHAVADGLAICKVRYDGVSAKDYAEPRNGSTVSLDSVTAGVAAVLWMADTGDGSNDRWAVVRIGDGFGTFRYYDSYEDEYKEADTLEFLDTSYVEIDAFATPWTIDWQCPNISYVSDDISGNGGGDGVCYITQLPAAHKQSGFVTWATQTLSGVKIFADGIGWQEPAEFDTTNEYTESIRGVTDNHYHCRWAIGLESDTGATERQLRTLNVHTQNIYDPSTGLHPRSAVYRFTAYNDTGVSSGNVVRFHVDPNGYVANTANVSYSIQGANGVWGSIGPVTVCGGLVTSVGTGVMTVAAGGTGVSTIPQYAVMIGAGTGAIQTAAPGTSGTVLMSNGASANPSFQAITDAHISTGIDCGTW